MSALTVRGRIWKFGDSIDCGNIDGVMGGVDADFKNRVKPGDILIAGRFFGMGASDEHAPRSLKEAGISGIVAESISNIFLRTLINIGLPAMECAGIANAVNDGDEIEVDYLGGSVRVLRSGRLLAGDRLPDFAVQILSKGGLMPYLKSGGQFK
ncbi:MAG TPA: 3-isopropylmalate dehydratase [Verrucomicrobiae bacterium]|jgi:3-isopropylmalate/(R)-2-methylmalate dehydratase small subunit|nr:3-isopropylmalate dehydratase [Verrucomicrobiae bacterium]